MSWNYRFVHKVARMKIKGEIHQEDVVDVHEVYYEDDGNIKAISKEPIRLGFTLEEGETIENDTNKHLDDLIVKLLHASNKPILNYEELMAKWGETLPQFYFES